MKAVGARHPRNDVVVRARPTRRSRGSRGSRAFTLIETLVVIAIIGVLLALLIPSLMSAREKMRMLKCASNMKNIAFEFQLFAEGLTRDGQGESEHLGGNRFHVEDFHESLYGIDEFWDRGGALEARLVSGNSVMVCPSSGAELSAIPGGPCEESIAPPDQVSLAINMRLFRPVIDVEGQKVLAPSGLALLSPRTTHHPYAPLMIDVDGQQAVERGVDPFYTAPPLETKDDPYAGGVYWSPARRHGGRTLVAFIGGHVLSSANPVRENWDWSYQAQVGN